MVSLHKPKEMVTVKSDPRYDLDGNLISESSNQTITAYVQLVSQSTGESVTYDSDTTKLKVITHDKGVIKDDAILIIRGEEYVVESKPFDWEIDRHRPFTIRVPAEEFIVVRKEA